MERGATVKAIIVPALGGPENLVLDDLAEPVAGPGELLVDVTAAGVTTRHLPPAGLYDATLPFIPGQEGAGTVAAVGEGVEGYGIGDRVGWTDVRGSYVERHAIPADRAVPIPDGLDSRTVAAVLLQGLTAHYLATDTFPLRPGMKCLIHAGAGGVGLLLTQIAKMLGAEVFTTVGRSDKAELSREAGSDHVIVYTQTDFKDQVEEIAGPKQLDVVYDGVGADTFMSGLDLLRPRGMMVTFGNASGPAPEIAPLLLSQKGSLFLTRPTMAHYLQTRDQLLLVLRPLFLGSIWRGRSAHRPRIPMANAADAHRALEGRQTTGKVLLLP